MKAVLKNYRQSPRKVRLLADMIRGKKVDEAIMMLDFTPKRASLPIKKLIASAAANAALSPSDLVVDEIMVNRGPILKRIRPRARGRAFPIHKHTSHVIVTLARLNPAKQ